MKQFVVFASAALLSTATCAQKQNIQNANNYLRDKDYKSAIQYINMAVNDPSTQDDPKAWFTRGNIYMAIIQDKTYKTEEPAYVEATNSFMKVAQLKLSYEKETVNQNLVYGAQMYMNDAIAAYNQKKYDDAYKLALKTVEIHDMDAGTRFLMPAFDTISSQAKAIAAYSAYYNHKYDDALPLLNVLKDDPKGREVVDYIMLADIYADRKDGDAQIAIIGEGRKQYPSNPDLRNNELNYYNATGKQDVFLNKLADAVAKDPTNGILNYNLATSYTDMAFPRDQKTQKDLPKPANYTDLVAKAKVSYSAAIKADPNNPEYNYNTGVLYFNEGSDLTKQMNNLDDVPANKAKYDELQKNRDALFVQAIPYFEKTYTILEPKLGSFTPDEKFDYQSALAALKEIYARQNNKTKSDEMKAKLDASRQK